MRAISDLLFPFFGKKDGKFQIYCTFNCMNNTSYYILDYKPFRYLKPIRYLLGKFARVFSLLPVFLLAGIVLCHSSTVDTTGVSGAAEIWVSPAGSDANPGTREEPLATLAMALRKARELRRLSDASAEAGIRIILRGGVYRLYEPVLLRPEDSGTEHSPTIVEAAEGEYPVLSGGVEISGWEKAAATVPDLPEEARGHIWEAPLPASAGFLLRFRQLWVNDLKAVRANSLGDGTLDRILSADKEKEEMRIPVPDVEFKDIQGLEFIIHQWWAIANLRVKSLEVTGDQAKLTFHQPESRIEFEHPWPAPFIDEEKKYNGNSAFYFANSIRLLNQPGEWYADYQAGKVYYWPRADEDMTRANAVAPRLESLVRVEGNLDTPVKHLVFKGIGFEHSTWMRPSEKGHVPLQAGMYLLDAYKLPEPGTPDKASLENQAWTGRQPAGVSLEGARHIRFESCSFRHMAATGLDLVSAVQHSSVEGCLFEDIGGTGIQAGFFGNAGFEAHLPYNPSDEREVCHHIRIANNLVTDCTNEDWGCVGIGVGYAHDMTIEHNEVSHLNYSGISLGWGWTKTISCMRNNRVHANFIHHFAKQMYDVGGIYTLSAQPNTGISENRIEDLEKAPYAHIPDHYQYIYFDEGSSYIRAADNWTEADKFFSNSPGPGNEWKNNGPKVSEEIKNKAGLEPEYRESLKSKVQNLKVKAQGSK